VDNMLSVKDEKDEKGSAIPKRHWLMR